MLVTGIDWFVDGGPPADVFASSVLEALLRSGRWNDAAAYCPAVDDLSPAEHAQFLLAAGWADAAHEALDLAEVIGDWDTPWVRFLRQVDAVLQGRVLVFPELVAASAALPGHPLVPLLMLRAADAAGQPEAAAHYAKMILAMLPGDLDAARAVALHHIAHLDYVAAVQVIERAEAARCRDEPSALEVVVDRLKADGDDAKASALVVVGDFLYREKDPTQPVPDAVKDARRRWRTAHHRVAPTSWIRRLAPTMPIAVGIAVSIAVRNAVPSMFASMATLGFWRLRPLPGLDARTSQLVREINDPFLFLNTRRYRLIDVVTFVITLLLSAIFVGQLPRGPSWLSPVEVVAFVAVAAVATRGRRRWVRRQRQRLLPAPLSPGTCSCLDTTVLHAPRTRGYVDNHLFPVGTVPGRADWSVLQCFNTHTRFLDLPQAELTVRLPPPPPKEPSRHDLP